MHLPSTDCCFKNSADVRSSKFVRHHVRDRYLGAKMRWTRFSAQTFVLFALLICVVDSQCDSNNDTIPQICQHQRDNNVPCTELNGECLECSWPEECQYGRKVNVTCQVKEGSSECQVRSSKRHTCVHTYSDTHIHSDTHTHTQYCIITYIARKTNFLVGS